MNKLKNRVQLIGNLGNDPVISTTATGKTVARLSLATNDHIRNKAGDKLTLTQWHNVVAWGKTAELCARYLKKGKEVALEGKLTSSSYTGKDGITRHRTEIVASELMLMGKA